MSVSLQFPTELLYTVISHVAVDYIDDLIAGSLALPLVDLVEIKDAVQAVQALNTTEPLVNAFHAVNQAVGEDRKNIHPSRDLALEEGNPIIPLLRTCVRIRMATLQVLSDLLGIELVKEGIYRYVVQGVMHWQ